MKSDVKLKHNFYLGLISRDDYTRAKEIALARCSVKRTKVPHYNEVIDEVIKLLIEEIR